MSSQVDCAGGMSPVGSEYAQPASEDDQALAEQTLNAARRNVSEAKSQLRSACQAASVASQAVQDAQSRIQSKKELLEGFNPLDPEARAQIESEIAAESDALQRLESEFDQYHSWVSDAEGALRDADDGAARATRNVQRLIRATGEQPLIPFRATRDAFLGIDARREQAMLFGTAQRLSREEKVRTGTRRLTSMFDNPAGAAGVLEQLLTSDEPDFPMVLLASAHSEISELASRLLGVVAQGDDTGEGAEGFASLLRSADGMAPPALEMLASSVARGLTDAVDLGAQEALANAFRHALGTGSTGGRLCPHLAGTLDTLGQAELAGALIAAMHDALDAARVRFERAIRASKALNARVAKRIRLAGTALDAFALSKAMNTFKDCHLEEYCEGEGAAKHLSALLEGAGVAIDLSTEGRLPKDENTGSLLAQSLGSIAQLDLIVETARGRRVLHEALVAQRQGKRTFLEVVPEVAGTLATVAEQDPTPLEKMGLDPAKFGSGGAPFLFTLGSRVGELLAPQLLEHRKSGDTGAAVELLKSTLRSNPELFGVSPQRIPTLVEAYAAIAYARFPETLRQALSEFFRCLDQSMNPSSGWVRSPVLQALAWVMALPSLIFDVSPTHSAELADALRASAAWFGIEAEQTQVIASMLDTVLKGAGEDLQAFSEIQLTASGIKPSTKMAAAFRAIIGGIKPGTFTGELPNAQGVEAALVGLTVLPSPEVKQALSDTLLFGLTDETDETGEPEDIGGDLRAFAATPAAKEEGQKLDARSDPARPSYLKSVPSAA